MYKEEIRVLQALRGLSAYPIPYNVMVDMIRGRGLDPFGMAIPAIKSGKAYQLAKADVLSWIASAPNITQGGQSYSFSEDQRLQFRQQAKALYSEYGDAMAVGNGVVFGYKGSKL